MYIVNMKEKNIDISKLSEALTILNEQLMLAESEPQHLVVCGGSALIATGLVPRTELYRTASESFHWGISKYLLHIPF